MRFSLASAALITRIVSRAGRGLWSQTGDKHGAAHVHVGCTVGICGRTQRLQAWARVQLRRDWLRMGPRSYRRRHRCHHRRTATGRSPPPSPPPAGVASSARLLAGRAARCLAHRRGHHLAAAFSPPLAANGVAVVCGCQMALRACAAATWRCAVCGCRMALRGVRLPNVAAGVEGALRLCRAVFLCVLCSFIRIDSVLSPLCSPTVTCLLMNTALRPLFYFKEHKEPNAYK